MTVILTIYKLCIYKYNIKIHIYEAQKKKLELFDGVSL
jgi:hypothetical protein